ncbi:MAG: hypothetical protein ACJAWL_001059 [Motiliproteus sp.]|jgi:hypothetical protein
MDGWYFSRRDLADQYFGLLDLGISSAFSIVAPRRKGKTLFVLQDVASQAQERGYLPVYASLWQNINAPHEGVILALEDAVQNLEKGSALARIFKAKIKKTAVANDLLGRVEVEFADNPVKPGSKDLIYLDELLSRLEIAAGKKTVLLLIDEVQHLATAKSFEPLAHALRTLLDKRQGRVKSLFTGSSRHYLDLLFNESSSPFYHFVDQIPFPDLDGRFVDYLRDKLANEYRVHVSAGVLNRVFQQLDHSPYWMMKVVAQMITAKATAAEAAGYVFQLMEAAEGYDRIERGLKPIDRLVFLGVCAGDNLFSKDFMARIGQQTAVKGAPSNVQRSVQRLIDAQLISQHRKGIYKLEKPGFKKFLLGLHRAAD